MIPRRASNRLSPRSRPTASACEHLEPRRLLAATTYFVSTTGNDANTGKGTSDALAYRTIQKAVSVIAAGDTVDILGGTYVLGAGVGLNTGGITLRNLSSSGAITTIQNYDSTPVYITGAMQLSTNTWTATSGGTYKTAYAGRSQQAFSNFLASNGASQTPLTEIGSDSGLQESNRVTIAFNGSTLPGTNQYATDGSFLYVRLASGAAPTTGQIWVNNPAVAEDLGMSGGASYYLIKGLNFSVASSTGASASDETTGGTVRVPSNSTLRDCNVYYSNFNGVELGSQTSAAIGCTVKYAGSVGFSCDSSANYTIRQCDVEFNNYRNFDATWAPGGIKMIPQSWGTIAQNFVANNNGTGIWLDTNKSGSLTTISDNYVKANVPRPAAYRALSSNFDGEAGIKIETTSNVRILNNVIAQNAPNGVYICSSTDCVVQNNTFSSNNGLAAILVAGIERFHSSVPEPLVNNTIVNNLVSHNSTEFDVDLLQSSETYVYQGVTSSWCANNVLDYNLYYRLGEPVQLTRGSPISYTGNTNATSQGPTYGVLEDWRAASGQDAHSFVADPLYAPSSGTWSYSQSADAYVAGSMYPLGPDSPAAGRGTNAYLALSDDYAGNARAGNDDVGAYEYAGDTTENTYATLAQDGESWVDDVLPAGAVPCDQGNSFNGVSGRTHSFNWVASTGTASPVNWITSGPICHSGEKSLEWEATGDTGAQVISFTRATAPMVVASTDAVYLWVYLPAGGTATEIAASFQSGTTWHTAYWGTANISTTMLPNQHSGGALPATGSWQRLSMSASTLGVSGLSITGLALAAYGGRVAWDDVGHTPVVPVAPRNLQVTSPSATQFQLSWTDSSSNEAGFFIQRSTDGTNFTTLTTVPAGSAVSQAMAYTDSSLGGSTTLYYRVAAGNAGGTSAYSGTATGRVGLVGAWQFEDLTAGVYEADGSGYGNFGLSQGRGATFANAGVAGDAAKFSGAAGSFARVFDAPELTPSTANAITVEAWVKGDSTGGSALSGIDKAGSYGLLATTVGASSTWEFYVQSGDTAHSAVSSSSVPNDGTWHFIVGTWDGDQLRVWIDNVVRGIATFDGALSATANPLEIGRGGGANLFAGQVDEASVIIGRQLTPAELRLDYTRGGGGSGLAPPFLPGPPAVPGPPALPGPPAMPSPPPVPIIYLGPGIVPAVRGILVLPLPQVGSLLAEIRQLLAPVASLFASGPHIMF